VAQESARTPTPTPAEASVPRATADAESDAAPDLLRAAAELEAAAASPTLRFQASAQLGRLWIRHGDLPRGIEWLERATETLAPVPEHGIAAQYDLGETLERVGRTDRALEVFRNLEMDASDYRDVRARIARLEQAGPSGHGA
jgi:lipopolysaccharide biosynthesis regulator YciM